MGIDHLQHGHAAAVVLAHDDEAELARVVEEKRVAGGLPPVRIGYHSLDIDVPIPLVQKIDLCTRLIFSTPDGREVAHVFVDMWGESYDAAYGMRVRLAVSDTDRCVIVESPGAARRAAWDQAVAHLVELVGAPLPEAGLREVLAAAVPVPLREFFVRYLDVALASET